MREFLRQIWVVLRYELADSVRSRRVLILLLLYLAGAMLACNGFISAIQKVEGQLSEALALPGSTTPGAVADALWRSKAFRRIVISLVGHKEIALEVLSLPPIAVIYGWLAFTFTPVLVVLSTWTSNFEPGREPGTSSATEPCLSMRYWAYCGTDRTGANPSWPSWQWGVTAGVNYTHTRMSTC